MSAEDAQTIATTWPGADRLNKVWRDALDTLIREKQAEAWFEGYGAAVAVLAQKHEEPNPYQVGGEPEVPVCATCGLPSTYRLGMPEPSWCDEHGPKPAKTGDKP